MPIFGSRPTALSPSRSCRAASVNASGPVLAPTADRSRSRLPRRSPCRFPLVCLQQELEQEPLFSGSGRSSGDFCCIGYGPRSDDRLGGQQRCQRRCGLRRQAGCGCGCGIFTDVRWIHARDSSLLREALQRGSARRQPRTSDGRSTRLAMADGTSTRGARTRSGGSTAEGAGSPASLGPAGHEPKRSLLRTHGDLGA